MLRIPNPLVSEIKPATFPPWASRQRERGHRLALPRVAPQLRNGTSKLRFETASKSRRMNAMCCSGMMNFSTVQFIHLLLQWRALNFSLSTSSVAVRVSAITSLPFFVPRKMSVSSVCVHTMRCDTMQVLRIVLAKAISNDLLKNLSTEQRSSERISQSNMCRFSFNPRHFLRVLRLFCACLDTAGLLCLRARTQHKILTQPVTRGRGVAKLKKSSSKRIGFLTLGKCCEVFTPRVTTTFLQLFLVSGSRNPPFSAFSFFCNFCR